MSRIRTNDKPQLMVKLPVALSSQAAKASVESKQNASAVRKLSDMAFLNHLSDTSRAKYLAIAQRLLFCYQHSDVLGPLRARYLCMYPGVHACPVFYNLVIINFWPLRGILQDSTGQHYAYCQGTGEFHLVQKGISFSSAFADEKYNRVAFI